MKRKSLRALCLLMTLSMLMGTAGCGQNSNDIPVADSQSVVESEVESQVESTVEGTEESQETQPVVKEKIKLDDLYQYANGEWLSSVQADEDTTFIRRSDELYDKEKEIIHQWFVENPENFDEAGMQNAVTFANQLMNYEDYAAEIAEGVKADLERVDQVSSMEELYDLYQDENFYKSNSIWGIYLHKMDSSEFRTVVEPECYFYLSKEKIPGMEKAIVNILEYTGVSEKESKILAKDFTEIEEKIYQFQEDKQDSLYYRWNKYEAERAGLQIPIVETAQKLGLINWKNEFWMGDMEVDFYNDLYQEKNLSMLKNHLKTKYILRVNGTLNEQFYNYVYVTMADLCGEKVADFTKEENVWSILVGFDLDATIADYYTRHVIGEENKKKTEELSEQVIASVRDMLKNNPWLSTHGKELAQRKINHMGVFVGNNSRTGMFDDVTFTEHPYDNMKIMASKRLEYLSALTDINQKHTDVTYEPVVNNSYYFVDQNALMIGTGALEGDVQNSEISMEELLGSIGVVLAHEIGHAYDFRGSAYTEYGEYEPWMTEEEYNSYCQIEEKVKTFFDGMKTQYGNAIDGDLVKSETFSDLMGMECCLNILKNMENPDYEAFFISYARSYAMLETAESEVESVKDTHLPAKERVNYVAAQFDEFYDTFDVDESSPYYVAKENRCWDIWKNE